MATPQQGEPIRCDSLFTFYNQFDDVYVSLDDESPDSSGPFVVKKVFGDRAIDTKDEVYNFTDLIYAKSRFMALVSLEIDAVVSQNKQG